MAVAPSKCVISYSSVIEDLGNSGSFINDKSLGFFRMGIIKSWAQPLLPLQTVVSHLMFWGNDFFVCIVGLVTVLFVLQYFYFLRML